MRFSSPSLWLVVVALGLRPSAAVAQAATSVQAPHDHEGSLFSSREASGTSWLPDATPMSGWHGRTGEWEWMGHGHVFAQFLYDGGEVHRTSHQFGSINWFMAGSGRRVGSGRIDLRLMMSLEPVTIGGCGYPNLLATGETCDGDSIHDLQHPHDLFMEVAAAYDRPLAGPVRWQIYGGLAGEPALGPPGFPHRLSAFPNPIAPISHHWIDSTHITFGVVTVGAFTGRWKAEASVFNGREPDEERFDLDLARFDSYSGRVSVMPTPRLVVQVSAAHLEEAEAGLGSQPRTDAARITASVIYHRALQSGATWATTIAYGQNDELNAIPDDVIRQRSHAVMVESSLSGGPHAWFGRFDVVGKPAHDLHIHEYIRQIFIVGKLQGGYTIALPRWKALQPAVGFTVSASLVPERLAPRYGGRVAPGFGVFLTMSPPRSSGPEVR